MRILRRFFGARLRMADIEYLFKTDRLALPPAARDMKTTNDRGRCRSYLQRPNSVGFGGRDGCRKVLPVTFLVLDSFSINRKIGMPEETPNFSVDPDGGM